MRCERGEWENMPKNYSFFLFWLIAAIRFGYGCPSLIVRLRPILEIHFSLSLHIIRLSSRNSLCLVGTREQPENEVIQTQSFKRIWWNALDLDQSISFSFLCFSAVFLSLPLSLAQSSVHLDIQWWMTSHTHRPHIPMDEYPDPLTWLLYHSIRMGLASCFV